MSAKRYDMAPDGQWVERLANELVQACFGVSPEKAPQSVAELKAIILRHTPNQPVEAGLPEGYVIVGDAAASVYHWELGDKHGWDFPTRQDAVESAWKHHHFK